MGKQNLSDIRVVTYDTNTIIGSLRVVGLLMEIITKSQLTEEYQQSFVDIVEQVIFDLEVTLREYRERFSNHDETQNIPTQTRTGTNAARRQDTAT